MVFQFSAKLGRWVYVNPPKTQKVLDRRNFKSFDLNNQSEYKIFALQGVGPKFPKTTGKSKNNFSAFQKVDAMDGGFADDVGQFL